jgi:pSer/pThr/pTyr-binding forkhead associated (FHA) protein
MPTLTLVSERTAVKVHEINSLVVNIGRGDDMDIVVNSVSVSRRQAQIRLEPSGCWTIVDLGSANGSFLNGKRILTRQPLARGDEISFGAFSLFFDRVFTGPVPDLRDGDLSARPAPLPGASPAVGAGATAATAPRLAVASRPADAAPRPRPARPTDTTRMDRRDVARLQDQAARKRRAHLSWQAEGLQGVWYLERSDRAAVLVGRSDLCDLRVPAAPRNHLFIVRAGGRYEIRNLSGWHRMTVNGAVVRRALLDDGDVIEIGRLHMVFADDLDA